MAKIHGVLNAGMCRDYTWERDPQGPQIQDLDLLDQVKRSDQDLKVFYKTKRLRLVTVLVHGSHAKSITLYESFPARSYSH